MRVMLDTNVLVSALLFSGETINTMMRKVTSNHKLVLSSYVVDELIDVTKRKFPGKIDTVEMLLNQLSYELVDSPEEQEDDLFDIRDIKDYPALYVAIKEEIDIFITGDEDFDDVVIEKPKIMTAAEFISRYQDKQYFEKKPLLF